MSKPVQWGVLGAAKFAREHMARAIHASDGAEFAALATSSPEKAAPFQAFQPMADRIQFKLVGNLLVID